MNDEDVENHALSWDTTCTDVQCFVVQNRYLFATQSNMEPIEIYIEFLLPEL